MMTPSDRRWHEKVVDRHVFLAIIQGVFLIVFIGIHHWRWVALAAVLLVAALGMAYRHKRILDREGEPS